MRASPVVFVQVEIVQRVLLVVSREQTFAFVWSINRKPVEAKPDHVRVGLAFVAPRRLHAHRIFVVVILAAGARVAAASIQSPSRIGFEDMVERVEENHTVSGNADRSVTINTPVAHQPRRHIRQLAITTACQSPKKLKRISLKQYGYILPLVIDPLQTLLPPCLPKVATSAIMRYPAAADTAKEPL